MLRISLRSANRKVSQTLENRRKPRWIPKHTIHALRDQCRVIRNVFCSLYLSCSV